MIGCQFHFPLLSSFFHLFIPPSSTRHADIFWPLAGCRPLGEKPLLLYPRLPSPLWSLCACWLLQSGKKIPSIDHLLLLSECGRQASPSYPTKTKPNAAAHNQGCPVFGLPTYHIRKIVTNIRTNLHFANRAHIEVEDSRKERRLCAARCS
ncbi:hypothetical protein F5890DRAFT_198740 [Lentinula detonsa]|uniref:Uncharacterized protein n=1 Tax=Lentinula detonsa TaxID=2804962 RepID=A0AA38PY69_9AGAR|nr:hypothetical protein F5890DRAFT_198740 [Lentinula detonsa]